MVLKNTLALELRSMMQETECIMSMKVREPPTHKSQRLDFGI